MFWQERRPVESYAKARAECSNQQLRSTLQQRRNEAEQFQYQLFQIAEKKGYYNPAPPADQKSIQTVKTGLSSGMSGTSGMNMH